MSADAPVNVADVISQATQLAEAGDLPHAVALLEGAVARAPSEPRLWSALAVALRLSKAPADRAIAAWEKAIDLNPDNAEPHFDLGSALFHENRFDQAVAHLRRATELEPEFPDAYLLLAKAIRQQSGDLKACAQLCREALRLDPDYAEAHLELGALLINVGTDPAEAERHLRAALALIDDEADDAATLRQTALTNLGMSFAHQNRIKESIAEVERALAMAPDDAPLHRALAHLLLATGDFFRGWREYEWRWHEGPEELTPQWQVAPTWDGSDLAGRTILLLCEQGFGDSIQFARYVPQVAAAGARVVLLSRPPLRELLTTVPGVAAVYDDLAAVPKVDAKALLLSCPLLCGTDSIQKVPAPIPYLGVPAGRKAQWAPLFEPADRQAKPLRVGLVWAGSPTHKLDRMRSVPVSFFEVLAAAAEAHRVQFYSLQKGPAAEQAPSSRLPLIDLGPRLGDFADTAAAIANLDLLISVDSAPAHLAGALGRPVWTLIPFVSDFRWLMDREDSPWYPTMRLFRQRAHDDWGQVIPRLTAEFAAWCEQSRR